MLTIYESIKLRCLKESYGILTADEALNRAVESEQIKRDCGGPHDPTWEKFAYDAAALENYAYLLEKESRKT